MRALTVVNVTDVPNTLPPPPNLRLRQFRKPTSTINCSSPLAAVETPSSPATITLNIPNRSAETLLSSILIAHRDGKARRTPSPRLYPQQSPLVPNTPTEDDDDCRDDDDDAFIEFDMVTTGAKEKCRINLSHVVDDDDDISEINHTEQDPRSSSSSSTFSSSSTLVNEDEESLGGNFRIHEFTSVTKLIGASPAMHRSSHYFVPPPHERRRPSYNIKRLYHRHHHHMTTTQAIDDDESSSTIPVFNFGFDSDPYLDEDFGVLERKREVEERVFVLAQQQQACSAIEAGRMKKKNNVRKAWKVKARKAHPPSPQPHVSKRIPRVPVPRYEDLDRPNTPRAQTASSSSPTLSSGPSESRKDNGGCSSLAHPPLTQQQVSDILWGDGPIDLASYWGARKRQIID